MSQSYVALEPCHHNLGVRLTAVPRKCLNLGCNAFNQFSFVLQHLSGISQWRPSRYLSIDNSAFVTSQALSSIVNVRRGVHHEFHADYGAPRKSTLQIDPFPVTGSQQ